MMTASAPTVSEQNRQDYVKNGFFILERVIPPEHLELLRNEAAHYMDQIHAEMDAAGKDVIGINHRNSRYFIANRYKETMNLAPMLFSDYMADICRATLGPNAYLFNEQYVIKAAEKGMQFAWHQDSGYVGFEHREYLSCWCALDDMTVENGTVFMLPYDRAGVRSTVVHTKEAGTNDHVGYHGKDPGDPVICPAGSIAVFSSNCFHRSGSNTTPRIRRVYLAQYTAEPLVRADGQPLAFVDPVLQNGVKTAKPTK